MSEISVLPKQYAEIEKIEVHLLDGRKAVIFGLDAQEWARTTDWGVRWHNANQIQRYGEIKTEFQWELISKRGDE